MLVLVLVCDLSFKRALDLSVESPPANVARVASSLARHGIAGPCWSFQFLPRVASDVFVIFVFWWNVEDACELACRIPSVYWFPQFCLAAFIAFLDMVVHMSGHVDSDLDNWWELVNVSTCHLSENMSSEFGLLCIRSNLPR